MNDKDLPSLADPELEQYFLVSDEKISLIYAAASIQPDDRVVELGAGVGTVIRHAPPCRKLTAVELDERLLKTLKVNVPRAVIISGDALELIQNMSFDVLISNLPGFVTDKLLDLLPNLRFRVAVLAVGSSADISKISPEFEVTQITEISGSDFVPPQPSVSRIVKITKR